MDTATIATLIATFISLGVFVLQIIQVKRYVKLESEVKRVTTELDQTLNRLHRALELTREIHLCVIRAILYLDRLVAQIHQQHQQNQQALWREQAKYEHVAKQAENTASLQIYIIELRATANVIGDMKLKQHVQELETWRQNFEPATQEDDVNKIRDLDRIIETIQERVLFLINSRLSARS